METATDLFRLTKCPKTFFCFVLVQSCGWEGVVGGPKCLRPESKSRHNCKVARIITPETLKTAQKGANNFLVRLATGDHVTLSLPIGWLSHPL